MRGLVPLPPYKTLPRGVVPPRNEADLNPPLYGRWDYVSRPYQIAWLLAILGSGEDAFWRVASNAY